MSDAVHVTIDDLLFVIGPNTSNVSNLNVSNSYNAELCRTIRRTRRTMTSERIPSGTFNGHSNVTIESGMHNGRKSGNQDKKSGRRRLKS